MTTDNQPDSNKAGDTHTTNNEYEKREGGINDVPQKPAENTGSISHTKEDLEAPDQHHDKPENNDKK